MDREKLESLLIDYIDGKLNSVDKHHVEQELMTNQDAYKLYEELKEVIRAMEAVSPAEPSSRLREGFENILREEMRNANKARVVKMRPWWYAAAAGIALLLTGLAIGFFISQRNIRNEKLAEALRQKEYTSQLVAMISDSESAGRRILGVREAAAESTAGDEIFEALIKTMDEDPNPNVRLAAIEALARFSREPMVRQALIASLRKQTDPVVQIALIQLMVDMKVQEAIKPLRQMADDETLIESVKDEAQRGILVLS